MRKGKRVLFYSLLEDSGFTLMLEAREVVNCGLSSRGGFVLCASLHFPKNIYGYEKEKKGATTSSSISAGKQCKPILEKTF